MSFSLSSSRSDISEELNLQVSFESSKLQLIGESSNSFIYSINNNQGENNILKVINHNQTNSSQLESSCLNSCQNHKHECKHLQNEFNIIKKVSHPNIIKLKNQNFIQDAFISETHQNGCCIILEKGDCDLLQMLSSVYPNVLEVSYLKHCFKKVVSALLYLHEEKKIAHNDIKLENIILFGTEPKISDFGFASKHESDPLSQVKNWLHRSKKNVAPEIISNMNKLNSKQLEEIKAFDERKTDVFALGIALFNALIHQNPFQKMADSSDPLYQHFYSQNQSTFWNDKQISRMMDFISTFENSNVQELKNLFEGMLNPNPKLRFSIKQVLSHPWFAF